MAGFDRNQWQPSTGIHRLFWLLCVVQEAKLSLKRLRTLVFGKPSTPPKEEVSEVLAVLGEADRGRGTTPRGAEPTKLWW